MKHLSYCSIFSTISSLPSILSSPSLLSTMSDGDNDLFQGDAVLLDAHLTPSPTRQWKLLYKDPLCNQNMRKAFYYEQTPNLPLVLGIVDLMASKSDAATFILDCCLTMSVRILPDSQGRVNAELDHDFVIG